MRSEVYESQSHDDERTGTAVSDGHEANDVPNRRSKHHPDLVIARSKTPWHEPADCCQRPLSGQA